jgi:hypothetical protein
MRRSTRLTLTAGFASALLALVLPAGAQACSCAATGSPREDARAILERSDAAFIGVLRSVKVLSPEPEPGEVVGPDRAVFKFRVTRSFEADLGARVKVKSTTDSAACGLLTTPGHRIALGLTKRRGSWSSSLCSYMKPRALRAVAGSADTRRGAGEPCA